MGGGLRSARGRRQFSGMAGSPIRRKGDGGSRTIRREVFDAPSRRRQIAVGGPVVVEGAGLPLATEPDGGLTSRAGDGTHADRRGTSRTRRGQPSDVTVTLRFWHRDAETRQRS